MDIKIVDIGGSGTQEKATAQRRRPRYQQSPAGFLAKHKAAHMGGETPGS